MNKIKVLPRPDNEHRTQEEWVNFFNTEKKSMISMLDVFQIVKENNIGSIESLRKDFKDYWLVTSTRIIYNPNNLSAKIIHNADSNIVKQTEINVKEVPVCRPTYLKELLENDAGLSYIRALIDNKKATKEQIINFFVTLSGKKEKNIRLWTPDQSSRKNKQVRSVDLGFGVFDWFVVVGSSWFGDGNGLSRGVIVNSAKQSKFFSNKAIFDIEDKTITMPMKKQLVKDIEKKLSNNKNLKISWELKVKVI